MPPKWHPFHSLHFYDWLNVRNVPNCSEPLKSDLFDPLEVSHRVRMPTEVKLQALHIIQLSEQPKALDKGSMFLRSQMNLTFVLHHFHNTREPLFQVRDRFVQTQRNGGSENQSRRFKWTCQIVCSTTAFFLLPSSGRMAYYFWTESASSCVSWPFLTASEMALSNSSTVE